MWKHWITLIIGIWLFISGLAAPLQVPANLIVVGILAVIFGFWSFRAWQQIVNGILGVWIFVSGLVASLINPVNLMIVGFVMVILSILAMRRPVVRPIEKPTV